MPLDAVERLHPRGTPGQHRLHFVPGEAGVHQVLDGFVLGGRGLTTPLFPHEVLGPTDRGRIHRGSVEGDGHQPQRGTGATTDVRHPLEQVPRGVVVAEPDGDPGEPGTRLRGIPSGGDRHRHRGGVQEAVGLCCHGNPAGSPVGARADDDHVRVEGLDLLQQRGRDRSAGHPARGDRHPGVGTQ